MKRGCYGKLPGFQPIAEMKFSPWQDTEQRRYKVFVAILWQYKVGVMEFGFKQRVFATRDNRAEHFSITALFC